MYFLFATDFWIFYLDKIDFEIQSKFLALIIQQIKEIIDEIIRFVLYCLNLPTENRILGRCIYGISLISVFGSLFIGLYNVIYRITNKVITLKDENSFFIQKSALNTFFLIILLSSSIPFFLFYSPLNSVDLIYIEEVKNPSYFFGSSRLLIDSLSINLIILNTIISLLMFIWIRGLAMQYYFTYILTLLAIQGFLNIAFISGDILTFFFCFEGIMFPMGLLIFNFGSQPRKARAAMLFFIYTLVGSIALILAMLIIIKNLGTLDILQIIRFFPLLDHQDRIQILLFLLFGFAVKVPICPLHSWLPEAHVEAPTIGSVILAALLLKLGGFGLLRFFFPLYSITYIELWNAETLTDFEFYFKEYFKQIMQIICIFSAVFASIIALRQRDVKRVIAYSSIAHMNLAIVAMFSLNVTGYIASISIMISHGLVSAALFLLIGCLYDRIGTRKLDLMGGIEIVMPQFAFFLFFFTISNFGFPFTANFFGELLVLVSITEIKTFNLFHFFLLIQALFVIILTIAYSLRVYARICLGTLNNIRLHVDLNWTEYSTLLTLLILSLIIGLFPNIIIGTIWN